MQEKMEYCFEFPETSDLFQRDIGQSLPSTQNHFHDPGPGFRCRTFQLSRNNHPGRLSPVEGMPDYMHKWKHSYHRFQELVAEQCSSIQLLFLLRDPFF